MLLSPNCLLLSQPCHRENPRPRMRSRRNPRRLAPMRVCDNVGPHYFTEGWIMRSDNLFAAVGISVAFGAAGTGLVACSSSTPSSTASSGSSSSSGSSTASCTLPIAFNPMYSAFDGTHTFAVPAVVQTVGANVMWAASEDSVAFQPNLDLTTGGYTGTTITVVKAPAGPITITATNGSVCGTATLNATVAKET